MGDMRNSDEIEVLPERKFVSASSLRFPERKTRESFRSHRPQQQNDLLFSATTYLLAALAGATISSKPLSSRKSSQHRLKRRSPSNSSTRDACAVDVREAAIFFKTRID